MVLKITEKEFRQGIIDLGNYCGWKAYFTWNSLHSPPGWLDLVLIRERVIFMELKVGDNKLTQQQQECYDLLLAAKAEVYVMRPENWDEIERILR